MKKTIIMLVALISACMAYAQGSMLSRITAAQAQQGPRMKGSEMKAILKRYDAGERTPEVMEKYAYVLGNMPARSMQQYAENADKAHTFVQDYFATLSTNERLSPRYAYIYQRYTKNYTDASAQFLLKNLKLFPAARRKELSTLAVRLISEEAARCLGAQTTLDASAFSQLRKDIRTFLPNAKDYAAALTFIQESSALKGQPLFDYVKAHYATLTTKEQVTLFGNFANRVDRADAKDRKQAAAFLRQLLPVLDLDVLYATIGQISQLENPSQQTH